MSVDGRVFLLLFFLVVWFVMCLLGLIGWSPLFFWESIEFLDCVVGFVFEFFLIDLLFV